MKQFLIVLTAIFVVSCNSSKAIIENTTLCSVFDDTITQEDLFFDTKKYNKQSDTIVNNDSFLNKYYTLSNGSITNKQTNKHSKKNKIFFIWKNKKKLVYLFRRIASFS